MVRKGAMASTSMVRTQSVGSASAMSAMGPNMPAALTRMVGGPKRATTASPSAATAAMSATSHGMPVTDPGWPAASASVSASWAALRATAMTVAPALARPRATPCPSPRPPPVTTATRPAWSTIGGCLPRRGLHVEDLSQGSGVDDAIVTEGHDLVHQLAPPVMRLGVP